MAAANHVKRAEGMSLRAGTCLSTKVVHTALNTYHTPDHVVVKEVDVELAYKFDSYLPEVSFT